MAIEGTPVNRFDRAFDEESSEATAGWNWKGEEQGIVLGVSI